MFQLCSTFDGWFRFMVFNATFNNISVISCQSVFIGGGNRSTQRKPSTCRNYASHQQTLSHNVESSTLRHERNSNSQL